MAGSGLANRRILVVEDEMMVAVWIEDILETLGCVIVGPVSKLEAAVQIVKEEQFDAAILDITIRGGQVFPVAEALMERHIPFVFASGYGDWALPENFRGRPRLPKPFTFDELAETLHALLSLT
jgi:CheY-like chemotaxis protein